MFLTARGVKVYYEQSGTAGPQVLLLHGWGCSTKLFDPIAQELSKDYRVTAIDFPGHGQSARPDAPWGVPEYAQCVREVMEQLGLTGCDVIAHSFGGRVAIYLSSHWPETIGRMVLTGCAGLKAEPTPEQKKRSAVYQKKKRLLENVQKLPLLGKWAGGALEALRRRYGSADYNALDAEMRKTFVKVVNQDLRPFLPDVKAPALLVWGENDTATPLWMGRAMEKEIPDAGLVLFENDDHFAYLHQWPRFVAVVRAFLK